MMPINGQFIRHYLEQNGAHSFHSKHFVNEIPHTRNYDSKNDFAFIRFYSNGPQSFLKLDRALEQRFDYGIRNI